MTYCSTDLSATSPPSYRQFINRFSTTCPPACQPVAHIRCEDRRQRTNPGLISVGRLDGERQPSVDSGVGISNHRFPDRRFALESSTAHSPPEGHKMPIVAATVARMAWGMLGGRHTL